MIRIFVGIKSNSYIPYEVLKNSILSRTKKDVQFTKIVPHKKWDIPEMLAYSGSVIYLEDTQLVFTDIDKLWNIDVSCPSYDSAIWATKISNQWDNNILYMDLVKYKNNKLDQQQISTNWNCIDEYNDYTHILQFQKKPPWVQPENNLTYLWEEELQKTIAINTVDRIDLDRLHPYWSKYA